VKLKVQSSNMRRASRFLLPAICLAPVLIGSAARADQLLDPGWQMGGAGVVTYAVDGMGQPVMGRPVTGQPAIVQSYQPAPTYYRQASMPQPRLYQPPAPVYYQHVPAPQPQVYQQEQVYQPQQAYQPQPQVYQSQQAYQQPAPVYYQQAPAPQQRLYQPAPASYQPAPAPQGQIYQPAPASYRQASAPQPQAYEPQYTGSVPQQPQGRGIAMATSGYQAVAASQPPQSFQPAQAPQRLAFGYQTPPSYAPSSYGDMSRPAMDPRYERQLVEFPGSERPGTIIIDTPHFFLYLVMDGGRAIRYGIGVGRPGFTWAGVKEISAMREWPDWRPPNEMLERRPDLPHYMPGGPDNPLGARALYLGSSLYRIHGSNEPWSIGTQVSSGCIRLRNEDVIDLYSRVRVGTKVVVI
jgi:lipoprotein-anchoring transpeptidase ErfK/SrfK